MSKISFNTTNQTYYYEYEYKKNFFKEKPIYRNGWDECFIKISKDKNYILTEKEVLELKELAKSHGGIIGF